MTPPGSPRTSNFVPPIIHCQRSAAPIHFPPRPSHAEASAAEIAGIWRLGRGHVFLPCLWHG